MHVITYLLIYYLFFILHFMLPTWNEMLLKFFKLHERLVNPGLERQSNGKWGNKEDQNRFYEFSVPYYSYCEEMLFSCCYS
jgi:hypothetical protein